MTTTRYHFTFRIDTWTPLALVGGGYFGAISTVSLAEEIAGERNQPKQSNHLIAERRGR
jgi:hypothetical protein